MEQEVKAQNTEDKTVAIISYLTIIGWVIALVMHGNNKTQIGAYHLRQSLGLTIFSFAGSFILSIIPILGWILLIPFSILIFVMFILGLVNAIQGQEKPLILVGNLFEGWFANLFK